MDVLWTHRVDARGEVVRPQGFTLVEVLASTVLLTLLVLTVMPMFLELRGKPSEEGLSWELWELQEFVDQRISENDGALANLRGGERWTWYGAEQGANRRVVEVRVHALEGEPSPVRWLSFECEGLWVNRRWPPR